MQIGIVLFGNGVMCTLELFCLARASSIRRSPSKAGLASELAAEMEAVRTAAAGTEHQQDVTNMAQGFVLAVKLLQRRGQREAQSVIMTISD